MDRHNLEQIAKELVELLCMKNEAYGSAFEDDLNEYGLTASQIQMGHKMKRIKTLARGDVNDNGESLMDSYEDLIGYGLLTLEWLTRNPDKLKSNV